MHYFIFQEPLKHFGVKGSQGASYFIAPNPPFGAVFTYYLSENYTTKKSARKKAEAKLKKEKKDIPFPGWDELDAELKEEKPVVILTIKDGSGNVVRRIKAETGKGFHRIAWDLRYPNIRAINLQSKRVYDEYSSGSGFLVVPGTYYASLSKRINGVTTQLTDSVSFNVVQMQEGTLPGTPPAEILSFGKEVNELLMANSALNTILDNAKRKVAAMRKALLVVETQDDQLYNDIYKVKVDLDNVERKLYGSNAKKEIGEKNDPTISGRIWGAIGGLQNTTYGPTQTQRMNFDIAKVEFGEIKEVVVDIVDNKIPKLELLLMKTGAPWIEGQPIPE